VDRRTASVTDAPYRIVTSSLVLRCWDPRDAPLLAEAVDESLDELRPWMPWAGDEPQTLEQRVGLLRRFRATFDLGDEFVYGIFAADESQVIGGTGLHRRVGEGLGTEATAALTRVAFDVCGVDRVEIRVDPANERSRAIPRKLGFAEEATLRRRLQYPEPRDAVVYSLFADELASSPAASAQVEAYDATGARVL
jgi:RimJ/RimL family protein N-acetyltransferase